MRKGPIRGERREIDGSDKQADWLEQDESSFVEADEKSKQGVMSQETLTLFLLFTDIYYSLPLVWVARAWVDNRFISYLLPGHVVRHWSHPRYVVMDDVVTVCTDLAIRAGLVATVDSVSMYIYYGTF